MVGNSTSRSGPGNKTISYIVLYNIIQNSDVIVTSNFHIYKLWVNAECQVARQCPRGGCPGNDADAWVFVQWEIDNN